MIDIFSIPLYYISFVKNTELEIYLKTLGFRFVHHFKSIDGKKFTPLYLKEKKIITIRSYNDLKTNRDQHSGLPTLGAVGCTMSHYSLWKKCLTDNIPYIIVVEDDVLITDLSRNVLKSINNKPNSIFVSSNIKKQSITDFIGLHFYILTNQACKVLVKDTFPIDVQTDHYIAHMDTIGKVTVEGFDMANQKSHKSSIQDTCIKCLIPNNKSFNYMILILSISIIIVIIVILSILIIISKNSYNKSYQGKV
jgi:hypothetical protein